MQIRKLGQAQALCECCLQAVDLYSKLGVKKQPLTLIQPEFEVPLPPLEPAVFPPALVDLPAPALELFDLEDHFASDHVSDLQ